MIPTPESIRTTLQATEDAEFLSELGYLDEGLANTISDLVRDADDANLFGEDVEISFWAVAGGDFVVEGGLVTLDFVEGGYDGPRFCSRFQDWKDLVSNREATGFDLAVDVITNVAHAVDSIRPKIQVLHGRHPDMGCSISVFVNDLPLVAETEDVDPGAGHTRSEWNERIAEVEQDTSRFGKALLAELYAADDSPYIEDES